VLQWLNQFSFGLRKLLHASLLVLCIDPLFGGFALGPSVKGPLNSYGRSRREVRRRGAPRHLRSFHHLALFLAKLLLPLPQLWVPWVPLRLYSCAHVVRCVSRLATTAGGGNLGFTVAAIVVGLKTVVEYPG
jgi:hypothetical protein